MNDYKEIEEKIKQFVLEELEVAKKFYKNDTRGILNCRGIAFGALQFATNNLFPCYNNGLAMWWEKEPWEEFNKLIRGDKNE